MPSVMFETNEGENETQLDGSVPETNEIVRFTSLILPVELIRNEVWFIWPWEVVRLITF